MLLSDTLIPQGISAKFYWRLLYISSTETKQRILDTGKPEKNSSLNQIHTLGSRTYSKLRLRTHHMQRNEVQPPCTRGSEKNVYKAKKGMTGVLSKSHVKQVVRKQNENGIGTE